VSYWTFAFFHLFCHGAKEIIISVAALEWAAVPVNGVVIVLE